MHSLNVPRRSPRVWLLAVLVHLTVPAPAAAPVIDAPRSPILISPRETDGIALAIWLPDGHSALPSDGVISFAFGQASTNPVPRIALPKPEYFVRATLQDREGTEVPRTRLGRRLGSRFSEVRGYSRKLLQVNHKDVPALALAWPGFLAQKSLQIDRRSVSPEDLFRITQPGNYTLRLEFQGFRIAPEFYDKYPRLLFHPIDVPVVKE